MLLNDRNSQIFIRAADLSTFTLGNFDIAASFGNSPGTSFTAQGFLAGVSTGTVTGSLGQFATFSGATLGAIDNLVFDGIGNGGGFELDNVNLNDAIAPVPEPATWAMLIGGVGLIGGTLRRRARQDKLALA